MTHKCTRSIVRLTLAFALTSFASISQAAEPPSPDSPEATQFGYASPDAALAALRDKPDVVISQQGGWTIADDKPNFALWSFTPPNHPAHPTAVKRVVVKAPNGDISIMMTAKCGSSKAACDKLIDEFRVMNARMSENVRSNLGQ